MRTTLFARFPPCTKRIGAICLPPKGVGPVAWSRSNPKLAYAVGLNHVFYRSTDAGSSWKPVGANG